MTKNEIIGSVLTCIGIIILTVIVMILYHLNKTAIWLAESLGATGEASMGIQIIIVLIGVFALFSGLVFGILFIIFGVGYLAGVTILETLEKIRKKVFRDFFDDDNYKFLKRF